MHPESYVYWCAFSHRRTQFRSEGQAIALIAAGKIRAVANSTAPLSRRDWYF